MMGSKDLEAEIHPLKNEDKRLQENLGSQTTKEDNLKGLPRQPGLSGCRTVAFFLSLFVCLFVVFVVSFIIPCPDRPASQGTWRVYYNAAVTYDFLATEDINRDRIQDVLFLYKNTNSSNNSNLSCADEGFSSPCTFVAAVSGANGSVLWERPAAQDGALVQCAVPQPQGSRTSSACILVGRPSSFVAVDVFTGETLWSHPSSFGGNASILSSLLQLPDVDADGAPDLLVLTQEEKEVSGYIYSGSTGHQIGHRGSLGVGGTSGSLLHVTRMGAHYILFPCASSLCGRSVKGLHETVTGRGSPLKRDPLWEGMLNATTHGLLWHSPGAIRYLMTVPGKVGEDLLLVSSEACVLLDGQELAPRWIFSAARVLRRPILGYYKPDTLAVVIENGTGIDRQILLLDLSTGAVLWNQALPGLPGDPQSASLPTADHRSAFFFWGLHELMGTNQTVQEPGDTQHSLYMFHPTVPGVLLELANISANIVAFQAVLFEPSRHAAYVLLTGPTRQDAPGVVSVAKHKVRDLVPSSRVVRLAEGGPNSDQAVRDRFSRLRYRSEA
ncbi:protein FAM234A [Prionailurus viverrinus]|uniref:protein FAM234A n=1 Tax=Prionailurus viverrinus TaxID=61388 RepID=UPI001FF46F86|nr:protein FAM234A [Prionailurus viverrinus]XP_047693646.1 protein FAM234A [Prionailurus viverrinus]XP_047693647.1 protein FAM234A [Prionailurus viverrinus]XP_047693648.1 protein FAM234A [Prionailurus viverrinus]XP_047693649.1 protein FAM234A [Prionailurus viverrinus]XP_047693650.1 protein FAM234A [Prionailurus viverrinus]XP_047693651.1 protein FAM234A [Prionailurus viverrinus]